MYIHAYIYIGIILKDIYGFIVLLFLVAFVAAVVVIVYYRLLFTRVWLKNGKIIRIKQANARELKPKCITHCVATGRLKEL